MNNKEKIKKLMFNRTLREKLGITEDVWRLMLREYGKKYQEVKQDIDLDGMDDSTDMGKYLGIKNN